MVWSMAWKLRHAFESSTLVESEFRAPYKCAANTLPSTTVYSIGVFHRSLAAVVGWGEGGSAPAVGSNRPKCCEEGYQLSRRALASQVEERDGQCGNMFLRSGVDAEFAQATGCLCLRSHSTSYM